MFSACKRDSIFNMKFSVAFALRMLLRSCPLYQAMSPLRRPRKHSSHSLLLKMSYFFLTSMSFWETSTMQIRSLNVFSSFYWLLEIRVEVLVYEPVLLHGIVRDGSIFIFNKKFIIGSFGPHSTWYQQYHVLILKVWLSKSPL